MIKTMYLIDQRGTKNKAAQTPTKLLLRFGKSLQKIDHFLSKI